MGVEIERKFLVDSVKWMQLDKPEGTSFEQGYLVSNAHCTVRIRAANENGYITIKGTTTGFSRNEYEYSIPVQEANELIKELAQSSLQKVRYCIGYAGKTWEVDVFKDHNAGLLLAEIELENEEENFELPPWVTTEVTGDERYYNSYLSKHPFKDW